MDPIDSIKEGAGGASEEALEGMGQAPQPAPGFFAGIGERVALLFRPDPRVPEMYVGKPIAGLINGKLGDEAEEAKLGESVNLCLDVLGAPGVGDLPPAAHLGWSGFKFVWLRRKKREQAGKPVAPV